VGLEDDGQGVAAQLLLASLAAQCYLLRPPLVGGLSGKQGSVVTLAGGDERGGSRRSEKLRGPATSFGFACGHVPVGKVRYACTSGRPERLSHHHERHPR
jgi:hypothetical protein